jgi:CHAT domain
VADVYGPDGVETADWQRLLARWTQTGGAGPEAALPIMRAALEVLERRLPPGHPLLTETHFDFAGLLTFVEDWPAAHAEYVKSEAGGETDRKFALDLLGHMQEAGQIDATGMAVLALPTLQLAAFGRARGAVDEQTKRLLFSSDQARGLYRQASDLGEARNRVEAAMSDLASQPRDQADPVQEAALRRELVDLTRTIDGLMAEVNRLEPGFAALTGDLSLTVPEIQALLGEDEVFVLVDHQRHDQEWSIAIAITRDKAEAHLFWQPVADLQGWVTAVRDSVALKLGTRAAEALEDAPAAPEDFPFDAAWQLYRQSFLAVWQLVDEKPNVLAEFRGPMTGLPPQLLLAYEPAPTDTLQTAPFLVRYKAVTVLPSVAALKTAELAKGRAKAPEPFAGFADPSYDAAMVSPALLADSGEAGANRLRGALAPLPETAAEVAEVRGFVAGKGGDVWLGDEASEYAAKTAGLERYAMVYFATHGLVGGDRSGTTLLTEAALALTPGQGEDGFLTASEIAQLRLAADWVVLSACNTAQGDAPGAEALSGLAQAFLYAGARALLVSHWPVESRSAAHLMTETFRLRAETPGLTAAEAQRQAMVAMIEGKADPRWAHPAYWAPFVIVGRPE